METVGYYSPLLLIFAKGYYTFRTKGYCTSRVGDVSSLTRENCENGKCLQSSGELLVCAVGNIKVLEGVRVKRQDSVRS